MLHSVMIETITTVNFLMIRFCLTDNYDQEKYRFFSFFYFCRIE